MDQILSTLRTHKFFICVLVFVTRRLVELPESRAAVPSSELCHADELCYVDVSRCNLLVDNSGKCSCHGNRCGETGHGALPLSWQQVQLPCVYTRDGWRCLVLLSCLYAVD